MDGRLVLPLHLPGGQRSVAFERQEQELVSVSSKGCGFMGLQGDFAPRSRKPVQVGPDPNLSLSLASDAGRGLPTSTEHFAAWLRAPGQGSATGVTTTLPEIYESYLPWASLHGAHGSERTDIRAGLSARGDLADQEAIPALWGLAAERKAMHTLVLIEADGAAAMMQPPGRTPPLIDVKHPPDVPSAFEVYVRHLGPGNHAAQCLVASIREWDSAGRPKPSWHIRALPAEMAYVPVDGEYLLERDWGNLVIRYV